MEKVVTAHFFRDEQWTDSISVKVKSKQLCNIVWKNENDIGNYGPGLEIAFEAFS